MRERMRKVKRLVTVQADLHRLAEWKLAGLVREGQELKAAQEDLLAALNEHETFHGLFVASMAGRLRRLAGDADRVESAQGLQSRRVVEEAMRLKRTERVAGDLGRKLRRDDEKRAFRELLDGLTDRDASLP